MDLSPLLFAIYLNDFENHVSQYYNGLELLSNEANDRFGNGDFEVQLRLYLLLYADNTVILSENPKELQLSLNAVKTYCTKQHNTVNPNKTKIVIFSRGKVRKYPVFTFGDDHIEVVSDYVYLGTTFNYNGQFKKAICKQRRILC